MVPNWALANARLGVNFVPDMAPEPLKPPTVLKEAYYYLTGALTRSSYSQTVQVGNAGSS